ncbi:MAG: histidine ammonia-lyase [Cuniculiplasma divulgatum]|jgi:histidine ammonia-lyase|nr:MAG: histidine ammonia-lyase [Cuniculiplasma divulgatum]
MIIIDGSSLTVEDIFKVASKGEKVEISDEALENVDRSHRSLLHLTEGGKKIYGVNTGFGSLLNVEISEKDMGNLQSNLIRSHSSGFGKPMSESHVRSMMLVRANSLVKGFSGVRKELVLTLVDLLNNGFYPFVPTFGSVGASGDLAPLAHVALAMMGEGETLDVDGKRIPAAQFLSSVGIKPFKFREKEGVAFINGTSTISGILAYELHRSYLTFRESLLSSSLSFEALKGTSKAFTQWAIATRPHPGQQFVAEVMRNLISGSENVEKSNRTKVQDPYTLRCIPQVYGAVLDTLNYVSEVISREINSVTDNPLVNGDEYVSVGNFHGEPVAFASDFLGIALTDLGNMIERRIARITDTSLSGLPAFLVADSGLNSGYMIPQYTAAALCNRNKTLANPSSADTIPTCANQEDHVSMGTNAATKLIEINNNLEAIVAIEFLLGAQALEFVKDKISARVSAIRDILRKKIPPLNNDRPPYLDMEKVLSIMGSEELVRMADSLGE